MLEFVKTIPANCKKIKETYAQSEAVQLTSSRVRLGQSFKTVGCGCTSCWGDLGAGSVEAET